MQIDIRACGFALTDAVREHADRRLRFASVHVGDRVRRVTSPSIAPPTAFGRNVMRRLERHIARADENPNDIATLSAC